MVSIPAQLLLAVIQGIAEWLPISSSGHLALAGIFLGIHQPFSFDVFLHLASLAAIFIYFRKPIASMWRGFFDTTRVAERRMIGYVAVSSACTIALAIVLAPVAEQMRGSFAGLASAFAVTTLVVGLTVRGTERRAMTMRDAVILGIVQGIAVIPGISRSGMVIGTALLLGMKRAEAFQYAFITVIPIILAAFVYMLPEFTWQWSYVVGLAATAVISLVSLRILERVVSGGKFHFFAAYTMLVVLILVFLS